MKRWVMLCKRPYSFTDEKTGKLITGVSCFLGAEVDGCEGFLPKKFSYQPDRLTYEPNVNEYCGVIFNEYGKISDFTPC